MNKEKTIDIIRTRILAEHAKYAHGKLEEDWGLIAARSIYFEFIEKGECGGCENCPSHEPWAF